MKTKKRLKHINSMIRKHNPFAYLLKGGKPFSIKSALFTNTEYIIPKTVNKIASNARNAASDILKNSESIT
ncbi:MAG: hypothetical protein HND50_16310 [Calditrichaeota bacterium]|nr:hypothetical protein [Calditrichota bacterium]